MSNTEASGFVRVALSDDAGGHHSLPRRLRGFHVSLQSSGPPGRSYEDKFGAMVGHPAPEFRRGEWIAGGKPDVTGKPYLFFVWATWRSACDQFQDDLKSPSKKSSTSHIPVYDARGRSAPVSGYLSPFFLTRSISILMVSSSSAVKD